MSWDERLVPRRPASKSAKFGVSFSKGSCRPYVLGDMGMPHESAVSFRDLLGLFRLGQTNEALLFRADDVGDADEHGRGVSEVWECSWKSTWGFRQEERNSPVERRPPLPSCGSYCSFASVCVAGVRSRAQYDCTTAKFLDVQANCYHGPKSQSSFFFFFFSGMILDQMFFGEEKSEREA